MITPAERRTASDFLFRMTRGDATSLAAYHDWLANPMTRTLATHLAMSRETDVPTLYGNDGIGRAISLAEAGAKAELWNRVNNVLFDFSTYAAMYAPREEDTEARPSNLDPET
jgi:hypothetical protein